MQPQIHSPRGPKVALRRLKTTQDEPRWAQDGPKMAQDGPKMAQDGPRWPEDGPKMEPRWGQDGIKTATKRPRHRLVEARCEFCKIGHAITDSLSKKALRRLKTAQGEPRWPQDGPKMAQDGPKMVPRCSQDGAKKSANWRLA